MDRMARKIISHKEKPKIENKEVLGKLIDGSEVDLQENEIIRRENKDIIIMSASTSKKEYLLGVLFGLGMLFATFVGLYGAIFDENFGVNIICIILGSVFGCVTIKLLFYMLRCVYCQIVVRIFGKKIKGTILRIDKEKEKFTIMVNTPVGNRTFEYKDQENCRFYSAGCIVELKVFGNIVLLLTKKNKTIENLKKLSFETMPDICNNKNKGELVYCRAAHINIGNCFSFLITGFYFIIPICLVIIFVIAYLTNSMGRIGGKEIAVSLMILSFCGVVLFIEIVCICKGTAQFFRYLLVTIHGKNITGEICGYREDDSSLIKKRRNRKSDMEYIIRIGTSDGYRVIEYKMSSSKLKYSVGEMVKLKVYKNNVMICGSQEKLVDIYKN